MRFNFRLNRKRFFVELGGGGNGVWLIELYDIENDSWSDLGLAPAVFGYPNFLIHGDEMYFFTGYYQKYLIPFQGDYIDMSFSYDSSFNYMYKHGKDWTIPGAGPEVREGWRIIEQGGTIEYCYSSAVVLD